MHAMHTGMSIDPSHQSSAFCPLISLFDGIQTLYLLKLKVVQILFATPCAKEGAVSAG